MKTRRELRGRGASGGGSRANSSLGESLLDASVESRERSSELAASTSSGIRQNGDIGMAALLKIWLPKQDRIVRGKNICILIVALLGVVSSIVQSELLWFTNGGRNAPGADGDCTKMIELSENPTTYAFKWVTSALTAILVILLLDYYRFQLKLERRRLRAPDLQLWHRKSLAVALLVELTVCSIHPLPWVSNPDSLYGERKAGMFTFLRLYLVFRVLRDKSALWQNRGLIEAEMTARGLPPPRFDWFLSLHIIFLMTSSRKHLQSCTWGADANSKNTHNSLDNAFIL
jgi:hypothetical protein